MYIYHAEIMHHHSEAAAVVVHATNTSLMNCHCTENVQVI